MTKYLKCKLDYYDSNRLLSEDVLKVSVLPGIFINSEKFSNNSELQVVLNGHIYQKNLLFLENDVLFNRIRKYWKQIENVILNNSASKASIQNINEVINLMLYSYQNLIQISNKEIYINTIKCIDLFKRSVTKLADTGDDFLTILTSSIVCNEEEPISLYFHSYLGIFYLILLIEKSGKSEKFQVTYECVIQDLIKLSEKLYQKYKHDVLCTQPFLCLCVKNIWIYLQHNSETESFWRIFNRCIEEQNEEFSLWLLHHISLLQCYNRIGVFKGFNIREEDVNVALVNKLLLSCLSNSPNEIKLVNVIQLLKPILTEHWIEYVRLEPYQILWDHFYKNLNNNGQDVLLPKTVNEFLDGIDNITRNPNYLTGPYELFLHLLHKHLTRHPQHWKKFQGRIYSRLHVQKINEFNNVGVYNIAILFCIFSKLNINDILEKLMMLLENLSSDRQNTELIWILHSSLLILTINQNQDVRKVNRNVQKLLKNVSKARESFHLIRHYINGLNTIFNSNASFDLHQNELLDSWIVPYMSTCSHADLCVLLKLFIDILKKAESCGKWSDFKPIYLNYVLTSLKQISIASSIPQIGKLASLILLNTPEIAPSLISTFCNESVNVEVTNEFLSTILDSAHLMNINVSQESALISAWVRICLLCPNSMKNLSKIFSLQTIQSVLFIEQDINEDQFLTFMKALHKQAVTQTNLFRLKELCELAFGSIDRWVSYYLSPKTTDIEILNLYTRISLIFLYCAPLLYQKSKSTCLLNRLIIVLLLPTEILMGKPPSVNILGAIEKTWHLFFKGIYKLDHGVDPYIDRTLKDLIVRYIPHFSLQSSPIKNFVDNETIFTYILEKISNNFLLHAARSAEENTFKALKLIHHILEVSVDQKQIKIIIQKSCLGICEVILFNTQKSMGLEVIKFLALSEWYPYVHSDIEAAVKSVTEKHLAFSTNKYFQFIAVIQKLIPDVVRSILPHIKEQIKHVERMRGVGYDNTLRQALERIEHVIL